jgi:hypothetical protein
MMGGFFAWYPMLNDWKTTKLGLDFIQRFRELPASVTILPDGRKVCHNETDDDGGFYLYKGVPVTGSPYVCTGLVYSDFSPTGNDSSTYMGFVYDATVALLRGIDYLMDTGIYTKKQLNSGVKIDGKRLKAAIVHNVSFTGVTGEVAFSAGRTGSLTYGYGDRIAGVGFVATTFRPINLTHGEMVRFGRWTTEEGFTLCSSDTPDWLGGCHDIDYGTPGNYKPADRGPDIIQDMPHVLRALIGSLAIVTFFITTFLASIIFILKAKTRLVKASQPTMMAFVLLGMYLGSARIALSAVNVTNYICHLDIWFGHLAFTFVFVAMVMKTWRLHMLVNRNGFKKVKITTMQIVSMTSALCSLMVLYLAIFSAVGRPHLDYIKVALITGNVLYKPYCNFEKSEFEYVVYSFEGLAIVIASHLCYATKDIPDAVNESKFISTGKYRIS